MTKQELMIGMIKITESKQNECESKLNSLLPDHTNERKALMIQKNLYSIIKTAVNFPGNGDEFPEPV